MGAVLLGGLIATGWSRMLRNEAEAMAGRIGPRFVAANHGGARVRGAALAPQRDRQPAAGLLQRFLLERATICRTKRSAPGPSIQAKAFGIGIVLVAAPSALIYGLIRLSPDRWWLSAGAVFALLIRGPDQPRAARQCSCRWFYSVSSARSRRAGERGC